MNANDQNHRAIYRGIAHRAMLERGLLPDFSTDALAELGRLSVLKVTEDGPAEGPLEMATCGTFCGLMFGVG